MGEYEPDDSRNVTLKPGREPGGIERTGPREHETREGRKPKEREGRVQDLGTEAIGARQSGEPVVSSDDPTSRSN